MEIEKKRTPGNEEPVRPKPPEELICKIVERYRERGERCLESALLDFSKAEPESPQWLLLCEVLARLRSPKDKGVRGTGGLEAAIRPEIPDFSG